MATLTGRTPALMQGELAIPVLERFDVVKTSAVSVGTSAVALPTNNLANRKYILVQNLHASNILYVGGSVPDVIEGSFQYTKKTRLTGDYIFPSRDLEWHVSASGTAEYYVTAKGGGDPSLTEPVVMYAVLSSGGSESLLTNGTMGSLSDHNWDWGDNDSLLFNTIYFRDGTGNPMANRAWFVLYGYPTVPSSSTAIKLGPLDSLGLSLSGSCRLFGVASGSSTTTAVMELA